MNSINKNFYSNFLLLIIFIGINAYPFILYSKVLIKISILYSPRAEMGILLGMLILPIVLLVLFSCIFTIYTFYNLVRQLYTLFKNITINYPPIHKNIGMVISATLSNLLCYFFYYIFSPLLK